MSGILLRWLNEDLDLKQRVLNLEHDFSNGYLLGEVLHVHNHQHDFNLFQDSSTAEARATNFILLEPPLRLLGVPFDVQMAYNIMNGKPGIAGKLLYQVKMVLDRLSKFSVPVSMQPTIMPAGVKPLPNLPQRTAKPQYDRVTHAIFAAAVRDMVQGKRGSTLERSLQRFEAEGARQKRHVELEKERSLLAEELHTEAIRVQGIHKLYQRKALCNSWEATNVDSWLINVGLKRNRELRNRLFRQTVAKARLARLQNSHMMAKRAVEVDIPDFEARSKEAARTETGNQEEHEATPWAFTASTHGFLEARALESGYNWQMEKFHAKRSEERTEARKKRRRRYSTEREESLSNDYLKEGTDVLKQKLMRRCRAEELVDRQLASVYRYKAIMTENRNYRKQQYAMRADVDAEGLLKRDQASLDSDRRDYELAVRSQAERCDAAGAARLMSAATRVEKMCRETLEGLIALSMEVVSYRLYSEHRGEPDATAPNQDPIPVLQWMDMKRSFVRGGPLLSMDNADTEVEREWGRTPLLPLAVSEGEGEGGNNTFRASHADNEEAEKVANFLDDCEFEDYINETGWWATQQEPQEQQESLVSKGTKNMENVANVVRDNFEASSGDIEIADNDEADATKFLAQSDSAELMGIEAHDEVFNAGNVLNKDDNVLNTTNPLYALGECVVETALAAHPLQAPEPPPAIPKFSMRICMCGRTLTGKSEQAIRLADRYCLKVLSAEELAQRALDSAANAMAAGRKTLSREEALGQEANSSLLQGGTISDKVYAALLVEAIKGIEEDNQASRAELKGIRGGLESSSEHDRTEYMGWVIDDFPGNADQALILEKYLSGYDERVHLPSRKDAASKLAPVAPVPLERKEKIPSGIDMVIYVDAPRETVLQRSLGRLYDPVTGEKYHFKGSLPQYDVVCKERLVRPEDPANPSAQLSLEVATQEQSCEELKAFLDKFGTLRTVESGESTPDALFGKINSVVLAMIQDAQAGELSTTNSEILPDKNGGPQESGGTQESGEEQNNIGGNLEEGGADPSSLDQDDPCAKIDNNDNGPLEGQQATAGGGEASSALGNGISSSTLASTTGSRGGQQEDTTRSELLTGGLAVAVSGHWRAAEQQFEETARRVFRELRNQRLLIGSHVRFLRDSFSAFLRRPDDKQTSLADFCSSFNSIEQDLRFDDRARKELLLRTEECRSRLWLDVEEREACASAMLKTIKEDGWLERQKGMISNHMIVLMQAEVERFHAGTALLHDYHHIKMQEVADKESILLVSLLPPNSEGNAAKDGTSSKGGGKRDKDGGKGGTKKDQDGGKGAKRRRSGAGGESPSGFLGARTALPPCLTLPCLVEVIDAGTTSQLASEAEETAAAAGQGKGKADKNKKAPKKSAGKGQVLEMEESKPPLAAALSMVINFADSWGPEGFPVLSEPEEDLSNSGNTNTTTTNGEPIRPQTPPPSPLLLHRAVWAQAALLAKRCRVLERVGDALSSAIQKKADLVYAELQSRLDARVLEETTAVETAMAMARDAVDRQSFIEHDWQLQGGSFDVDESVRLVPAPDIHRPYSEPLEKSAGVFSESQALRLQDDLYSIRHTGTRGDEVAVVTPEDVVDALLRLSEEEGALPVCWSCASKEELMQFATRVLDPDDIGQVEVEKVVSSIASNTPEEVMSS